MDLDNLPVPVVRPNIERARAAIIETARNLGAKEIRTTTYMGVDLQEFDRDELMTLVADMSRRRNFT